MYKKIKHLIENKIKNPLKLQNINYNEKIQKKDRRNFLQMKYVM